MNHMLSGSCLCRAITYQITATPLYSAYCHCSQCRRFSGSAFAAIAGFRMSDLKVMTGAELLASYTKTADADVAVAPAEGRSIGGVTTRLRFCKACGSSMFAEKISEGTEGLVHLRLGTVETPLSFRPQAHVHLASKAAWFEIPTDGLPRFEGAPPRDRVPSDIQSRVAILA